MREKAFPDRLNSDTRGDRVCQQKIVSYSFPMEFAKHVMGVAIDCILKIHQPRGKIGCLLANHAQEKAQKPRSKLKLRERRNRKISPLLIFFRYFFIMHLTLRNSKILEHIKLYCGSVLRYKNSTI